MRDVRKFIFCVQVSVRIATSSVIRENRVDKQHIGLLYHVNC